MKFEKRTEPKRIYFSELEPGTLFHNPGNDDIYMKVAGEDESTGVHLMTGELDGFFSDDEVIVVDGTLVWEDKYAE